MKISILHLSDIHFKDNDEAFVAKAEKICAAIQEKLVFTDVCFVLVTGDVAWSGQPKQYAIAKEGSG